MAIENGYCTLSQVKASLRITDSVDDELLELAVEAASREIDTHTERQFYQTTETRVFTARDSYVCEIDDLASLTSLKTQDDGEGTFDTVWTSTDYQLEPLNGYSSGIDYPFTHIRAIGDFVWPILGGEALVQVEGTFGWPSVPTAIKQATVILASRIYKRNDSPLGVTGFGDLGMIRVSRVDPDVAALCDPYRRMRMA